MTKKLISNPWTWQKKFGFHHCIDVIKPERLLFISGQVSVNATGTPCFDADMVGQINQVFDNLQTVLTNANASMADVVRLVYYTTDVDALLENWPIITRRLSQASCDASSSMIGVTRLSSPAFMLEIEATAAL